VCIHKPARSRPKLPFQIKAKLNWLSAFTFHCVDHTHSHSATRTSYGREKNHINTSDRNANATETPAETRSTKPYAIGSQTFFLCAPPPQTREHNLRPPCFFYQNRSHGISDILFSLFCVFLHTIIFSIFFAENWSITILGLQ
jgi:hypothetical protein